MFGEPVDELSAFHPARPYVLARIAICQRHRYAAPDEMKSLPGSRHVRGSGDDRVPCSFPIPTFSDLPKRRQAREKADEVRRKGDVESADVWLRIIFAMGTLTTPPTEVRYSQQLGQI
jgi:hypothetical protein